MKTNYWIFALDILSPGILIVTAVALAELCCPKNRLYLKIVRMGFLPLISFAWGGLGAVIMLWLLPPW
jgi:hypothetical protein